MVSVAAERSLLDYVVFFLLKFSFLKSDYKNVLLPVLIKLVSVLYS
jgi:hypothetical protein